MSDIITKEIPLPNTFNVKNTVQIIKDLQEISISERTHLASFDIKDIYTNIPTKNLPQILNLILQPNTNTKEISTRAHNLITHSSKTKLLPIQESDL